MCLCLRRGSKFAKSPTYTLDQCPSRVYRTLNADFGVLFNEILSQTLPKPYVLLLGSNAQIQDYSLARVIAIHINQFRVLVQVPCWSTDRIPSRIHLACTGEVCGEQGEMPGVAPQPRVPSNIYLPEQPVRSQ